MRTPQGRGKRGTLAASVTSTPANSSRAVETESFDQLRQSINLKLINHSEQRNTKHSCELRVRMLFAGDVSPGPRAQGRVLGHACPATGDGRSDSRCSSRLRGRAVGCCRIAGTGHHASPKSAGARRRPPDRCAAILEDAELVAGCGVSHHATGRQVNHESPSRVSGVGTSSRVQPDQVIDVSRVPSPSRSACRVTPR